MTIRIAAVQMSVELGAIDRNLEQARALVKEGFRDGAEWVILPEFFPSAVAFSPVMLDAWEPLEQGRPLQVLRSLAREHDGIVGGSFIAQRGADCFNTFVLALPDGRWFFHDKSIPTVWENSYYRGGFDDGVIELPAARVGVAMCWEMIQSQTARRLAGNVDVIVGGSCWWDLADPVPQHHEEDRRRLMQMLGSAPGALARMTGAPFVHASHAGRFSGQTPGSAAQPFNSRFLGETQIVDGRGNVLARMGADDGAGVIVAEIAPVAGERTRDIPPEFWSEPMPAVALEAWGYNEQFADHYQTTVRPLIATRLRVKQMEDLLARLLLAQLLELGMFRVGDAGLERAKALVAGWLGRWLDTTVRLLVNRDLLRESNGCYVAAASFDAGAAWQAWDAAKPAWLEDADLQAKAKLVGDLIKALPEILTGRRLATDFLFKDASMTAVEDVYKNASDADIFNIAIADAVAAYVDERRSQTERHGMPFEPVRILEIGAGTGATSAAVFARFSEQQEAIGEYCYTDLSRAFILHAQACFGARNPFLTYKIFDVEQAPGSQDLDAGSFDLVVATNVLHATKDVRRTLRNAKSLLKRHGLLLLNEVNSTGPNLFTHMTFGLTKGWWLFEDDALRVRGSPAVRPQTWKGALELEGFRNVFFPLESMHGLGQQVVVAESDGLLREGGEERAAPDARAPIAPVSSVQPPRVPSAAQPRAHASDHFRERVCAFLVELIGSVLKIEPAQIDVSQPLERYGMDSIVAVQMAAALSRTLADVSSMLFLEHTRVDALAAHLIETRGADLQAALGFHERDTTDVQSESVPTVQPQADPSQPARLGTREEIAIIGVAGRYPHARTLDELWDHLRSGTDLVTEIPADRWDVEPYFDAEKGRIGKTCCRWGSFLDGVNEFDPSFFNITPIAADNMDPQIRLALQTVWETVESAGHTRPMIERRYRSRVGVYFGAMYQQYQLFDTDYVVQAGIAMTSYSAIANRISNFFNFKGPSVALDTQCSSSMIAVHMACKAILSGECEAAIAGGVNLILHPKKYLALSIGLGLASTSRSRSFSHGDGFIPSEGVGAVMLKPLSRAVADGDRVLAVIKHSAQSHAGRGIGYGTQDPNAQFELIQRCLEDSSVDARSISYVEAAANGSLLGDAMEASSLCRAYKQATDAKGFCAIGTVKSNMGHLEAASGIAQLTKVILQLQKREIAPMLSAESRNPNIKLDDSPFYFQTQRSEWRRPVIDANGIPTQAPRRAAINTFGGGGSLVHVIVEEFAPDIIEAHRSQRSTVRPSSNEPNVIVLSARDGGRLQAQVSALKEHVEAHPDVDVCDIAWTLQTAREPMEHRLALIVRDRAQLLQGLLECEARWGAGADVLCAGVEKYIGSLKAKAEGLASLLTGRAGEALVQELLASRDCSKLALYWAQGGNVSWESLHAPHGGVLVDLPHYPFERRRCWVQLVEHTEYTHSLAHQRLARNSAFDELSPAEVIYAVLCTMLGMHREELDIDAPLSRYEMTAVLLPRLRYRLHIESDVSLEAGELRACQTARDVARIAQRARRDVEDVLEV